MNERFETFTVLISKVSRNIRKIKNAVMADERLRSSHVSCIYYLYLEDSLTATELCERCEEDKATISRSISYLEKNGYLVCEPKTAKRYKSPIILTEKGKEVGERIARKIDSVLDEMSKSLSEEDRLIFYRSFDIISQSLEAIASENEKIKIDRSKL